MFCSTLHSRRKSFFIIIPLLLIGIFNIAAMEKQENQEDIESKNDSGAPILYKELKKLLPECIKKYETFLKNEKIIDENEVTNPLSYIQKIMPQLNNEKKSFHLIVGDIHASPSFHFHLISWLMQKEWLNKDFKIIKANLHIDFLGDIADYGPIGAECWRTILLMKLQNWQEVNIIRGNHERKRSNPYPEDFKLSLNEKFGLDMGPQIYPLFLKLWTLLPSALCIGDDLVLCHGGLPCTYQNKEYFLSDSFIKAVNDVKTTIAISPQDACGLAWNDCCGDDKCILSTRGENTPSVGTEICEDFRKKCNKKILCKGHQHNAVIMWEKKHYKEYVMLTQKGLSTESCCEFNQKILKSFENIPQFTFDLNALQNDKTFFGVFTFSIFAASYLISNDLCIPVIEQENNISQRLTIFHDKQSSYMNL